MANRVLPSREGMQRKIDGHQEDWLADDDDLWTVAEKWASGRLVDQKAIDWERMQAEIFQLTDWIITTDELRAAFDAALDV